MPKRWPGSTEEASHLVQAVFPTFRPVGHLCGRTIYVLLAYIAAVIGLTQRARPGEQLRRPERGRSPAAGRLLLGLLAVGLVAYAVWRIAQALSGDQGFATDVPRLRENGRSSAAKDA